MLEQAVNNKIRIQNNEILGLSCNPISKCSDLDPVELKPKLRGIFHGIAFICTSIIFILFIISSIAFRFNLGIFIYMISQLLQFGVSASYHIPNWNPKVKRILRHIDHICIFLLISGTQTSVLLNTIPADKLSSALNLVKMSWAFSIIGICRLIFLRKLYDIFDLICYICHGTIVLFFYKVLKFFGCLDLTFLILGGIFYLMGGVIFGLEKPNPFPRMMGYHEIFHIFTLLANACFGIVIVKDYIKSMVVSK